MIFPFNSVSQQATFKLGLSYLPLAEAGISSLQLWIDSLPVSVLRSILEKVLPLLDDFLRAGASTEGALFPLFFMRAWIEGNSPPLM